MRGRKICFVIGGREFGIFSFEDLLLAQKNRALTMTTAIMMNGRFVWTFLCILALLPTHTYAAHSRRRPTTVRRQAEPRYDRSITTFSPSGNLQQVEYSMEASRRGDPIVAMTNSVDTTCIAVHSSDKVHRIDDSIIMITAGLVGDGRLLASTLRSQCQQFKEIMGEAPTVHEAARMAAELQHLLTRTPGRRPLACTAILAGVEQDDSSLRLFQTDPGGILEEFQYCSAGKGQEKAMAALESLSRDLETDTDGESGNRMQLIQGIAKVALEASKDNNKDDPPHVDIWILQPESNRRGGIHLQCIQKVTKKDVSLITERLLKKER